MFVMLPFMPESPRYLISRGKNAVTKTYRSLSFVHRICTHVLHRKLPKL